MKYAEELKRAMEHLAREAPGKKKEAQFKAKHAIRKCSANNAMQTALRQNAKFRCINSMPKIQYENKL